MITAVIPVHNRANLLERLLQTAERQTVPFAEVIVVDNGSSDNAVDVARRFGCTVIPLGRNCGFASAVNRGWSRATTPWVAILNSDVELDSRWAESLLAGAGEAGFATGLIRDAANRTVIDGTYDLLTRAGCAWRAGHGEAAEREGESGPISIAPGTACLFRTDTLRQMQGFDESFGSYLEDVDLGMRCLRAGISGVYVPAAVAWHYGSATFGRWDPRVVRLIARNQLRLICRHYDRSLFLACLWPILAGQVLWGLIALRHGAGWAWLAGKWDGLRHFRLEGRPNAVVREFLAASEKEIHARAKGTYWWWYFFLTSPGTTRPGSAAS